MGTPRTFSKAAAAQSDKALKNLGLSKKTIRENAKPEDKPTVPLWVIGALLAVLLGSSLFQLIRTWQWTRSELADDELIDLEHVPVEVEDLTAEYDESEFIIGMPPSPEGEYDLDDFDIEDIEELEIE
ncbi:hypothetical protein PCE1_004651 [Barthelona sp. PCE]